MQLALRREVKADALAQVLTIAVVDGITKSKIQQMLSYGAELFEVAGFGKNLNSKNKCWSFELF